MNAAYRHLEAKTRIGELTLGQWAGILLGVLVAVAFALVLKPFSGYVNLALGIYIGGLPAAAVFLASISEVDFWLIGRSALRFRRADGRYLPGGGRGARGYAIRTPAGTRRAAAALDLGALWDGPHADDGENADNGRDSLASLIEETGSEPVTEVSSWH